MRKNGIIPVLIVLLALTLANCEKDEQEPNQNELLGTWIALGQTDTLDFTTRTDFYKSNGKMDYDHYDYQLFADSIEIRYRGKQMILVQPTKHEYEMDNGRLTIDFSNKQCYGFPRQERTYLKQ